jgi:hypothetical protein
MRGGIRIGLIAAGVIGALAPTGVGATELPSLTPPVQVVPSAGLPPQVVVDRSNANLSVTRYRGRIFLVFRTAKWQLADTNARLYVLSSTDQIHWRFEGSFTENRDLREPRLLAWHQHLFLYFALLGSNAAAFEPGGTVATQWLAPERWTAPKRLGFDDFIPWSVKVHDHRPYMLGYTGGGGTFTVNSPPKNVYWLTTANGIDWHPVNAAHPIVYTGQCGETDFAFLPHGGGLVTACQTEEHDALGWGAKICTAPAAATWQWTCRGDPRRLDSPFVFTDRGQAYVIARRQPNFHGLYDLGASLLPTDAQFALYDGLYAATTKRCALWSIDTVTRTFAPLTDIPGTGDTCYPSLIREPGHRFLVYNYTSPLDGTDRPWITALTLGTTLIYRTTMTFP